MFAKRLIALVVGTCCTTICQSFVAPIPVVIQAVKIRQESWEASASILPRVSIKPSNKRALSRLHLASQFETLKDNETDGLSRRGSKVRQKGRENALWKKFWQKVHRLIVVASLAAAMTFSFWLEGANAVSSGRMGGSFGRSSSSSSSSSFGGSYSGSYSSSPYRSRSYSYHNSSPMYSSRPLYYSRGTVAVERRSDPLGFLIFAGFVGFVGFDYWRKSSTDGASTVVSLTLSLEIPDRDNPNNVLAQLEALSRSCDTSTRQGVATLLSNVSLVLARQQDSVFSANLSQQEFNQDDSAEREFNRISVQERTKFETELINKFGKDIDMRYEDVATPDADQVVGSSTLGIVTLTVCVASSRLGLPNKVATRGDLRDALTAIASSVQVGDNLMSGEVLWAPQGKSDLLTDREIYSRYPDLVVL